MSPDIKKNNLHYYVDLLRMDGKQRDPEQSETCVIALHNVIRTMRFSRHDKICGEDFSRLNFGNIPFNGIHWSMDGKNPCRFDGCTLNEWNFMSGHSAAINSVSWSPDEKYLISGSDDGTAVIWDVKTGFMHQKFITNGSIYKVDFITNQDGIVCGVTYENKVIRIWNINTGDCIYKLKISKKYYNHKINDYSIVCEKNKYTLVLKNHFIEHYDKSKEIMAVSENGRFFVAIDAYMSESDITLYEKYEDGCMAGYYIGDKKSHYGNIIFSTFLPSNNSFLIIFENNVILCDLETVKSQSIIEFTSRCIYAIISPNQHFMAAYCACGMIFVWNLDTRQLLSSIKTYQVKYISFSHKGNHLAVCNDLKLIKIYDIKTGACVNELKSYIENITSHAITPDGHRLLLGTESGRVYLWNIDKGKCQYENKVRPKQVSKISVSADGSFFLSNTGIIDFWSLSNCKRIRKIPDIFVYNCYDTLFCYDNKHFIISSCDNPHKRSVYLFNADEINDKRKIFEQNYNYFVIEQEYNMDYSLNNLLIVNDENKVELYDIFTGDCLYSFDYRPNHVDYTAISPNGNYYLEVISNSNGNYNSIYIKNTKDNSIKYKLDENIIAAAFSSNSNYCLIQTQNSFSKSHKCRLVNIETGRIIRSFRYKYPRFMEVKKSKDLPYIVTYLNAMCKIWYHECFSTKGNVNPKLLGTFVNIKGMYINNCAFKNIKADSITRHILYQYAGDIEKPKQ